MSTLPLLPTGQQDKHRRPTEDPCSIPAPPPWVTCKLLVHYLWNKCKEHRRKKINPVLWRELLENPGIILHINRHEKYVLSIHWGRQPRAHSWQFLLFCTPESIMTQHESLKDSEIHHSNLEQIFPPLDWSGEALPQWAATRHFSALPGKPPSLSPGCLTAAST